MLGALDRAHPPPVYETGSRDGSGLESGVRQGGDLAAAAPVGNGDWTTPPHSPFTTPERTQQLTPKRRLSRGSEAGVGTAARRALGECQAMDEEPLLQCKQASLKKRTAPSELIQPCPAPEAGPRSRPSSDAERGVGEVEDANVVRGEAEPEEGTEGASHPAIARRMVRGQSLVDEEGTPHTALPP